MPQCSVVHDTIWSGVWGLRSGLLDIVVMVLCARRNHFDAIINSQFNRYEEYPKSECINLPKNKFWFGLLRPPTNTVTSYPFLLMNMNMMNHARFGRNTLWFTYHVPQMTDTVKISSLALRPHRMASPKSTWLGPICTSCKWGVLRKRSDCVYEQRHDDGSCSSGEFHGE